MNTTKQQHKVPVKSYI